MRHRPLTSFAAAFALAGSLLPARAFAVTDVRTLSLSEAVTLAKERAPIVHEAFARIASAEASVDHASAFRLPAFWVQGMGAGFTSNGQVYNGGGLSSGAMTESYLMGQGSLNMQWALYDFGHTSSAIDSARAGVRSANLTARASEQAAMAEAAVAFFTLMADDEFLRSTQEVRADRERVLAMTHRLVEVGIRTPVDETRAEVGLDVAKLDVSTAEATRDNDAVNLASALLIDPTSTFRLVAPGEVAVDENVGANGSEALRARYEVAAGAARVEQTRHDLDSARHAYLPVLGAAASGTAQYTKDRSTVDQVTSVTGSPTEYAQGTLTLTVPVFDPLIRANVRVAEASVGEATANLERLKQNAVTEATRASTQVRSARLVLAQAMHLTTGSTANLTAVEARYSSGMESPLALADAQREDAIARVAVVRARLALEVARVHLLAALSRTGELARAR